MNRPHTPGLRFQGFTLLELLVSIAVLAILGLLLSQATTSLVRTVQASRRTMDATTQARFALDRISADLSQAVQRRDIDFIARNPSVTGGGIEASNALYFLSLVTAPGLTAANNRSVSMVAYRVGAHQDLDGRLGLLRAAKPVPWNTTGWGSGGILGVDATGLPVHYASSDSRFPAGDLLPVEADYDVLSAGIFRLIVGFQLYPDGKSVRLANGSGPATAEGQIVYSPPLREDVGGADYVDLDRISSIVVGVAGLDDESLKLLTDAQVQSLATQFTTPAMNQTPVAAWTPEVETILQAGTYPQAAIQNLRVHQRFIPINPYGSRKP